MAEDTKNESNIPSLEDELNEAIKNDNENNNNENNGKKKKKKLTRLRIVIYVILFMFICGIIGVIGLSIYIYILGKDLPSTEEFSQFKYNEPMVVYDANGEVIAELGAERRYPVPIEQMPKHVYLAVVAVEDGRFFEHAGIDPWGIARAMFTNLKAGRMVEGGSTLTQQLVKVTYLSSERKLKRKLKEAIIAYRLDRDVSKEKILELYLNQVNFGRGAYGIQAAAINYFGKEVQDLTIAEAAMIAGIPKGPSIYAPHRNMQKSIKRRNHVLNRMKELGFITEEEYTAAKNETVNLVESVPLKLRYAGYFMDYVRKYIEEDLKIADAQNIGVKVYTTLNLQYQIAAEKALLTNLMSIAKKEGYFGPIGVLVKYDNNMDNSTDTNNDEDDTLLGKKNEEGIPYVEFNNIMPSYMRDLGYKKALVVEAKEKEVSIMFTDNSTGTIRLSDNKWANLVQPEGKHKPELKDMRTILQKDYVIYVSPHSKDKDIYNLEQDPDLEGAFVSIDPQSGAIYAMVGGLSYYKSFFNRAVQAKRQIGSTIKPLIYSAAYESGFYPMSIFYDTPVIEENQNDADGSWRPKNFDGKFIGKMTLKEALEQSNNSITIQLAKELGVPKIKRYFNSFGLNEEMPDDLSISLGSLSSSPIDLAYSYATFANQGLRPEKPFFITRVADIDNKTLFEFQPPAMKKVLEPASASLITENLISVVEHGGAWRSRNNIFRMMGGKTGTSNNSKDAWYAGVLPNLVSVAWVGYDDYKNMNNNAFGGNTAQFIWIDYMKEILDTVPVALFPKPVGVSYFKVDNDTFELTDRITGNVSFEMFPVDNGGNIKALNLNK